MRGITIWYTFSRRGLFCLSSYAVSLCLFERRLPLFGAGRVGAKVGPQARVQVRAPGRCGALFGCAHIGRSQRGRTICQTSRSTRTRLDSKVVNRGHRPKRVGPSRGLLLAAAESKYGGASARVTKSLIAHLSIMDSQDNPTDSRIRSGTMVFEPNASSSPLRFEAHRCRRLRELAGAQCEMGWVLLRTIGQKRLVPTAPRPECEEQPWTRRDEEWTQM